MLSTVSIRTFFKISRFMWKEILDKFAKCVFHTKPPTICRGREEEDKSLLIYRVGNFSGGWSCGHAFLFPKFFFGYLGF